ncbi:MAG: CBS domain-containing protein [Myxococcales bacterium]|nr:CBS domain-containing protein [Myxococcales bacterium]
MNVGSLASATYATARPFDSIASVRDALAMEGFVVVEDDDGRYQGLLTARDLAHRPHVLVTDCLTPKSELDWQDTPEVALRRFEDGTTPALPVLADGRLVGVLCYADLARHYRNRTRDLATRVLRAEELEVLRLFAASIGHDLNNIVFAALGYLEFALSDEEPVARATEDMRGVLVALQRAQGLARQLMNPEMPAPQGESADGVECIRSTAQVLLTRRANIDFQLEADPELPRVALDGAQLSRVMLNLLVNAIHTMPEGGVLTCAVRDQPAAPPERPQRQVRVSITDTGPGLPSEVRAHIFEPYYTTKPGGSGLGLAIVHDIVRSAGGTVDVSSEPGRGCTFTVTLPAAQGVS